MRSAFSRRGFLGSLGAGLIVSPGRVRSSQSIQGAGQGNLRLAFHTDIHADEKAETFAALEMAAEAINAQNTDLVLCGGDLIGGGFTSTPQRMAPRWNAYLGMARSIHGDQHAVIGNHDLVGARPSDGSAAMADPRREFKDNLGLDRTYGSFDALGYRFILLDSLRISREVQMYDGWVSTEQRDWLRVLLSSTPADMPIVLLSHMPLLTAFFSATEGGTYPAQRNRVVINNVEVLELFAGYNLVLVLQGHLHVTEEIYWRGTTFLTGGAVCGKWWRGGAYFGTSEGFTMITLGNNRIEWEYLGYGWNDR